MLRKFLFLILLLGSKVFAQELLAIYGSIQENTTQYVYADIVNVREGPGIEYTVTDKLKSGEEVIITSTSNKEGLKTYTQNGITAYWLHVNYYIDGIKKQGYVWQGNLTFTPIRRKNTKFIYGLSAKETSLEKDSYGNSYEKVVYKVELKILIDNKVIAKKIFYTDTEQTYTVANVYENLGLKEVNNIIRISFQGEACGVPTYYYYFAWNGKEILDLPSRYTVGDAGVYYYEEEFIFPIEKGGKPNKIIKKIEERELQEDQESTDYKNMHLKRKIEEFVWTGKNYK